MVSLSLDWSELGKIVKIVYDRHRAQFEERRAELADPTVIYVTDLVSCTNKYFMRRLYPDLAYAFEPPAVLGDLAHAGLESLLREHGFLPEFQVEKHVEVGSALYRVKGRVDAYNPDTGEVVEIKTARTLRAEPYEHHLAQINIYLNMLGSERGYLVYFTHDRIAEFAVRRAPVDLEGLVARLLRNEAHPLYAWECDYCPFRKLCPMRAAREEAQGP